MQRRMVVGSAVVAAVVMLAGCGGATVVQPEAADTVRDLEYRGIETRRSHSEIGVRRLADYEAAMLKDAGYGWFVPWTRARQPVVVIPWRAAADEEAVIRRAVAVLNRALPLHMEIDVERTTRSLSARTHRSDDGRSDTRLAVVRTGHIHVEFVPIEGTGGFALAR